MKAYLLAGAAALMLAAPAQARDNSAYFGLEIGPMWLEDMDVEANGVDVLDLDHKLGVDGDLIAGYDFGMFRAEAELSHKWAKWDEFELFDDDGSSETFDADGHTRAYTAMVNAMVDLGDNESFNFYAGGGAGFAWLRANTDEDEELDADIDLKDNGFAWQLIAGVRAPVFTHFDVGLKYRYFRGPRIEDDFEGDELGTSRWKSHSLLASLIYNFAPPPPPPPPPPPALPPAPPPPPPPATQVCPDGSVVLATDVCPMPPPPPPPPPPEPERG
jgi:OOP family OmpA-OmpF porin